MNILKPIDRFLNYITMYKLTLYILFFWFFISLMGSLFGFLPFIHPINLLLTGTIAISVCFFTNLFFAKLFKAVTNIESVFITALIITFIVPVNTESSFVISALVSFFAMASKYFFATNKKHILNPAAAGVIAISLLFNADSVRWWIGNQFMFPFVLIGALLIVRKTRREYMFYTFQIINLLLVSFAAFTRNFDTGGFLFDSILVAVNQNFLHSAVIFFGAVMLTEPLTSPTSKSKQIIYASIVAFLHATPQLRIGGLNFTPEMALIYGNILTFIISPTRRYVLKLSKKIPLTHDTTLFVFDPVKNLKFKPGQYLEWTLPHKKADNRGNRRFFSLASSPTEESPKILIKHYDPPSSFKNNLFAMPLGSEIIANQLSGDFILPKDLSKPLVFIAGGVGFAPFRSMLKYIIDKKLKVNINVIFANKTPKDVFLQDLLNQAKQFGVNSHIIITDEKSVPANFKGIKGHLTGEIVKKLLPDFSKSSFYISGPQLMVQSIERTLRDVGVSKKNIVTDFFPGYDA